MYNLIHREHHLVANLEGKKFNQNESPILFLDIHQCGKNLTRVPVGSGPASKMQNIYEIRIILVRSVRYSIAENMHFGEKHHLAANPDVQNS